MECEIYIAIKVNELLNGDYQTGLKTQRGVKMLQNYKKQNTEK